LRAKVDRGHAHDLIHTVRGAGYCLCGISVRDDGPGVPSSERVRIFDRFYRLERSRSTPGDGLGLALVSAIARLHGATLDLSDGDPGLDVRIGFAVCPSALRFPNVSESPAPKCGD